MPLSSFTISPREADTFFVRPNNWSSTPCSSSTADKPAGRARLAYLVSRYPAVSHTFILREVRHLRKLGFDIEVASINPPDRDEAQMTADEREENARTYYIKRHGLAGALMAHLKALLHPINYAYGLLRALRLGGVNLRQIAYAFFYFTEALMLARWMKSRGLSHLHVHFASAAANVGLVLKGFHPVNLSLTVHGPDEFYDAPGQWLRQKIAAADFIVCIGAYAKSQLMHLSPAQQWYKFEICPLGVSPQDYVPMQRAANDGTFNVLCVGRLAPAKGQRILIDACRHLRDEERDIRLVLVGTGPDEQALKDYSIAQGLEGMIEFAGALNQDEVKARYANADAFALASFAEGIPVVLMEAMASGVPVVATRITGIPELIRDGQDGLLVAPSDTDALSGALARLMDDKPLRNQLARSGRKRVTQRYQLERNVHRLGEIFRQHIGVVP